MRTSSSGLVVTCVIALLLAASAVIPRLAQAQAEPTTLLEKIAVVGNEQGVGVEIVANATLTTEAQMLTGPDRLVIDFPGALPGRELRGFRLNQGEIKAVRAGLFRSNPPVTRVVVDLNAPTGYRLVPSGKAVIVKLGEEPAIVSENSPGVTIERHPTARALAALAPPADPPLRVGFDRGLLTISAQKATLAEVLYQVHLKTGADIPIPSGAEQEQVVIQAGPAPAKDVLAALLNGSRFNYVLEGTALDPQGVSTVILSPKANIGVDPPSTPPQPVAPPPGQMAPPTEPPNPPMQPDGAPIPPDPEQTDPQ